MTEKVLYYARYKSTFIMAKTKTVKKVKKLGATAETVSKPKRKVGEYSLEVRVNDVSYLGSADSLSQALTDFMTSTVYTDSPKTKTVIQYSKGDSVRNEIWNVVKARRLFHTMSLKPSTLELIATKMQMSLG